MARLLFGKSVKGATHARNGMPLQDSFKIDEVSEDVTIIAVADGHGSEKCPKSKNGSQIAVNAFCKVMRGYLQNYENQDELITYLNREGELKFSQDVCQEWQRRVRKSFNDSKAEKPKLEDGSVNWKSVYQMYGTTLIGLLITSTFIFAFQIGDGDAVMVDGETISPIVESEKMLGTETHSLSKMDAWRKAVSVVRRKEDTEGIPYLYMLSTDGFVNSYLTDADYQKTCRDYFTMIGEYGFGKVCDHLEGWLQETSELGCGDDITLALAYFK